MCRPTKKVSAAIFHPAGWKPNVAIVVALLLLLLPQFMTFACGKEEAASQQKVTNLRLSTDEGFRIYQHWTNQAFSSLMSAFLQAKINDNQLPTALPEQFSKCYLQATTLPSMAKCICELLTSSSAVSKQQHVDRQTAILIGNTNTPLEQYKERRKFTPEQMLEIGKFKVEKTAVKKSRQSSYRLLKYSASKVSSSSESMRRRKRVKRSNEDSNELHITATEHVKGSNYSLSESKRSFGLSPVGGLARLFKAMFAGSRKDNNKAADADGIRPWQKTVADIKELGKIDDEKFNKNNKDPVMAKYAYKGKFQKPFTGDIRRFESRLQRLERLEKVIEEKQRMEKKSLDVRISELVKEGIRIGMLLGKQMNSTGKPSDIEDAHGSMDVLSPRFLSITERNVDEKSSLFSPSVFSLHNKGKGLERALSLPKLMKDSHLTGRDQQEWLDLIMEASGVNRQVDAIKEQLSPPPTAVQQQRENDVVDFDAEQMYKREFKGLYWTKENVTRMFGDFEKRKIETWEELERKFTDEQRDQLNQTGFSLLNTEQLELVYGPASPFNDSEALDRLQPLLENCSCNAINEFIENDIQLLAEMRSFDVRHRDVVRSPLVFNPTISNSTGASQSLILSPLVFSPTIRSPTIFGPAILSPSVFSPTILSPRLMTPLVLSPFIFSTTVLSPLVMQPFILSPGVINGVILSPFVMNPNVLSPQIMHPFILSPLVMTPGIVNPTLMSPLVLSPFVMNPQILSPKAFAGLFLSPYALTPVLLSPTYFYLVFLSPGLLS